MACPLINLLFFLFMFLPFSTLAQTSKNISLGSSLTALNDDNSSSWTSPSGDFAFGFQRIGKDGFLLAIWFDKIKDKTIVWSANGDNLVPEGSKVELSIGGDLMLTDATGKRIWSAQSVSPEVAYASCWYSQDSSNVWESFDEPTDTILPTQILNQNNKLFARYTATNYSRGRFIFPLPINDFAYYATMTMHTGFQVIFNHILNMVSSNTVSMQNFYHKVTLEHDGVLRHSFHPKTAASSVGSPMAWSPLTSEPSNICLRIGGDTGSGACGYNSLSSYDDKGPTCRCPSGYIFIDPNDVLKGCKQNFVSQSCDEALLETEKWAGGGYEQFTSVSEEWCRQNCLDDCFCVVAIFKDGGCEKKRIPLSNGRMDTSIGGKALVKVRKDNSTFIPEVPNTKKKDYSTLILIGSVLLSSSGFLNLILLLTTYLAVSRISYKKVNLSEPNYPVISDMNLKHFTYEELKNATNEFKDEVGRGASAIVFKGVLASNNEKSVAVKSLVARVGENDLEFKAEMSSIGRTNHRNLVQLLGFCYEGEHRMLVYEFMSNGSLASFLYGELRPSWYQRRKIALGIARGLLYLHEECCSQIVHCDIKPQNIVLDDSFVARISDFGLAKLLRMDQTRTTTGIRGTKGYVAPEWFNRLPITAKVDVFSFGILLFEIIFCRKHFEPATEDEDQMILADWAYDCYKQNNLHQLFKNDDEAMHDIKMMEKYVMIAIWCIQEDPSLRPTMKKVALMLEGTVEVSAPPNPCSFISSII
ncbi:G-type lectin S-receptor-like serine/threonine-protein kinase RLK1 [Pyrus ussuriensis x Pyrus communis]|uniref:Receptor-like serine/threonine-protein kinase n=1 Tax=Pyrus ussuriensis x Pyrus communis TaxID=2448454 RepID=A0A5N5FLP1_9ROSA|nr:G-type lectin S-receptor-like serine/threonine-protein kinase RLK1 [Pyrus ussuriensis x Pyrus communis]